jgi:type I site-specific restriction endonuclease
MFSPLNLPQATLKINKKDNQFFVRCLVRKKTILLTPEEWVRQHLINYLVHFKGFALGRLAVEVNLTFNGLAKRADLVYYDEKLSPSFLFECKAADVHLTSETVFQIATYNSQLNAPFLVISNGLDHYIFEKKNSGLIPLNDLPVS